MVYGPLRGSGGPGMPEREVDLPGMQNEPNQVLANLIVDSRSQKMSVEESLELDLTKNVLNPDKRRLKLQYLANDYCFQKSLLI